MLFFRHRSEEDGLHVFEDRVDDGCVVEWRYGDSWSVGFELCTGCLDCGLEVPSNYIRCDVYLGRGGIEWHSVPKFWVDIAQPGFSALGISSRQLIYQSLKRLRAVQITYVMLPI